MTANHTPGPWAVNPLYPAQVATADGGLHIASACTSLGADAAIANAALIAAAPDLLAALETVLANSPEPYCAITRAVDLKVRSAIAKATGAEQ